MACERQAKPEARGLENPVKLASVRLPAAYCGIVGLRPTYGPVSIRGVMPLAWTLDTVGPMCRTAADTALWLQAIVGYDQRDPVSVKAPPVEYPAAQWARTATEGGWRQ